MADQLAEELAELIGWKYGGEPLGTVYSALNATNSALLHSFFQERFTNVRPSADLRTITSFPWSRIYTLNIDDSLEAAIRRNRTQHLRVFSRTAHLEDVDPIFKSVQVVKLNGSADRPQDGFIFSPQEYGQGSHRLPIWYRQLGYDYSDYTFLFIGSRLQEPLFQHAIAEMRSTADRNPITGYVITPTTTNIETYHLRGLNLVHVPGTVGSFSRWLLSSFPEMPTGWDLATARRPELRNISESLTEVQKRALNSVTLVSPEGLPRATNQAHGAIRDFYRGYKPNWNDIVDGVHANLSFYEELIETVASLDSKKCVVLVGAAGSGKTTALMAAALSISRTKVHPVYYLRESVGDLKEIVRALEEINSGRFYLFIDKIEAMHHDISDILSSSLAKNISIVASERLNIWNRRVRNAVDQHVSNVIEIKRIRKVDAERIISKLETFGPWTRLQSMKVDERIAEVFNKADRQLLIGLMEATTGLGFTSIIERDFATIGEKQHQLFLILVGFASIHRSTLSSAVLSSALQHLSVAEDINKLAIETAGVVVTNAKKYSARHPVYVRELFEKIAPTGLIRDSLKALLSGFSEFEAPIIKNVSKADGVVFKSVINHRFVKEMMRDDEDKVRSIYAEFETAFHVDGLYWLQYGLSLRAFGHNIEALDKFKTARAAYNSAHIEHAYAQQLMIIASEQPEWESAEPLLKEAIELLRWLQNNEDEDTYPIVSLAEGHITVRHKFFGIEGTRTIAQHYANELIISNKKYPSPRLSDATANVVNYYTNGIWDPAYGPAALSES